MKSASRIRTCRNKCVFCFVEQNPPGVRRSLMLKDDDYRQSYMYGAYITLNNLSEKDYEIIVKNKLSPLYVSVHTTDPDLREEIMGNRNARNIMDSLKKLCQMKIDTHVQIVVVSGVNDGRELESTIDDLIDLYPRVKSISVVPVGMTKHRKSLQRIKGLTESDAEKIIRRANIIQADNLKQRNKRIVFCSDELYIKAKIPFPEYEEYEDFHQIENGVGLVRNFIYNFRMNKERIRKLFSERVTAVTGSHFYGIFRGLLEENRIRNVELVEVKNEFLGNSVGVAGLMAGADILSALKNSDIGKCVLVPTNALKKDEDIFIDGVTLGDIREEMGVNAVRIPYYAEELSKHPYPSTRGELCKDGFIK